MKNSLLVYNNSLFSIESFVDSILKNILEIKCSVYESPCFYYISLKHPDINDYSLEVNFKNNFLILKVTDKKYRNTIFLKRIFYLTKIEKSHILFKKSFNKNTLIIEKTA